MNLSPLFYTFDDFSDSSLFVSLFFINFGALLGAVIKFLLTFEVDINLILEHDHGRVQKSFIKMIVGIDCDKSILKRIVYFDFEGFLNRMKASKNIYNLLYIY